MESSSNKRHLSDDPDQPENDGVGVWEYEGGIFTQENPRGPSQFVQTECKILFYLLFILDGTMLM
jgi:hypothetical protein